MSISTCTSENPYTEDRDKQENPRRWEHEQAVEVGQQEDGWPCGDIVRMRCKSCGVSWKTELPQ